MAAQRPAPSPLPAGLEHLDTPEDKDRNLGASKMSNRRNPLPEDVTAEHYARKASELLLELRNAEKRWEGCELEYQERELQLRKHVTMVEATYQGLKDRATSARSASMEWEQKCKKVTDLCTSDKYESWLLKEQQKNEELYLQIREAQAQVASKEKDMAFLRATEQETQQLRNQLQIAERRAHVAEDRALESQRKVQAWQSLQADAARTLSTGWTSKGVPVDPGIGTSLPRSESLQFQQQTESPASSLKKAMQSSSPNNPVLIFRQVYKDKSNKENASLSHPEAGAEKHSEMNAQSASGQTPTGDAVELQRARRLELNLGVTIKVLRDVAELCKYHARSLLVGYQRLMKPLIGQHIVVRDIQDPTAKAVRILQGLCSPQQHKTLEVVASAMARVCSISDAHFASDPGCVELTVSEQAALKAEGKRLRRAAEHGVFAILGSTALLGPVVRWSASHGPSLESGSTANNVLAEIDEPPGESKPAVLFAAQPVSRLSSVHESNRTVMDPATSAGTPVASAPAVHVPEHYSGDQIREMLDNILHTGPASVTRIPHDKRPPEERAVQPNEPITARLDQRTGVHSVQQLPPLIGEGSCAAVPGEYTVTGSHELEPRLLQIQQDLAEVMAAYRSTNVHGVTCTMLVSRTATDHFPLCTSGLADSPDNSSVMLGRAEKLQGGSAQQEHLNRRWTMQEVQDTTVRQASASGERVVRSLTLSGEDCM